MEMRSDKLKIEDYSEDCYCYICRQQYVLLGKKIGPFLIPAQRRDDKWQLICPRHLQNSWDKVFESGGAWPQGES